MLVEKITTLANNSEEINVIIEIPMQSNPVKYEIDKKSGTLFVDRFMQTAMFYPGNYGFIPHTMSEDGDPVDVLVIAHYPVVPGCVIRSRPIGVLMMEDESGLDEKIIAVPSSKLDITFDSIKDLDDLCPMLRQRIVHFFEHYKDIEKGKWVKVIGWENAQKAKGLIDTGISRAKS
ncbi:inorganic diphosphatase [Rickettsia endosymbiont of Culicoides newsteadi]|uniref:inorganic diphosphatase n=1 Tax=Rickettsia endosymbiont of Culicoides newsteadi TaxID=1961830 RepID=UPI000B9B5874|nr:inorganic diphosphatase [Rickettsia endosymbiont of Culicoides newsteadi]OZG32183.1 inorganic pyrophosphatase [Rickettsia endosymbiont of Culicoides newsteadi]